MTIWLGAVAAGDPALIRLRANDLRLVGAALQDQARIASTCSAPQWRGAAAAAFAARLRPLAPILERASERYLAASGAVSHYADALADLQATQRRLVQEARQANLTDAARQRQEGRVPEQAGPFTPAGPPALPAFDPGVAAHLQTKARLTALWHAAWEEFERADRGCATELRRLHDDGLDDSGFYTFLHTLDSVGGKMALLGLAGLVPSPFTPILLPIGAIGAGLTLTSQVGLKVGYDEGAWSEVAFGAAFAGLGGVGKVLKGAATLTRTAEDGITRLPVTSAERLRSAAREHLITNSPLNLKTIVSGTRREFAKAAARRADGAPGAWPTFVAAGPPGIQVGQWTLYAGGTLIAAGRKKVLTKVRDDYITPWYVAKANGNDASRFIKISYGIEALDRTKSAVDKAIDLPGKVELIRDFKEKHFDEQPPPASTPLVRPEVGVDPLLPRTDQPAAVGGQAVGSGGRS